MNSFRRSEVIFSFLQLIRLFVYSMFGLRKVLLDFPMYLYLMYFDNFYLFNFTFGNKKIDQIAFGLR